MIVSGIIKLISMDHVNLNGSCLSIMDVSIIAQILPDGDIISFCICF